MISTLLLLSTALLTVQADVTLEIKNLEIGPIWVGIKEKEGKTLIENGGFELLSGKSKTLTVPDDWAGKFWPRTWCNWPKPNRCLTGECGGDGIQCLGNSGQSPFSSIDLTLKGEGGYDYYDVSLANGYNIAVAIEPVKGTRNNSHHFSCSKAACAFNFQQKCPGPLRLRHENQIVACMSPCLEYSADEHCCHNVTGNANAPEVCRSLEWRDIHPGHFKLFCKDALTYDLDTKNIFTCKADTYRLTFGGAW